MASDTDALQIFFFPRGQYFRLTFRCQPRAELRLSILRKRLEPGECVVCSFRERPEGQAVAQCTVDFCTRESAVLSSPDRHVGPRLNFLSRQKIFHYPCERRVLIQCGFDLIKHSADA